jgi:serine protease
MIYRDFLAAAGRSASASASIALAQGLLRFTLEYATRPDEAAERAKVEALIGGGSFQLFRLPPGADPLIYILQFPDVPREQSAGFLFAVADFIRAELDLRSCTPDVDPGWIAGDELDRMPPESVGDLVWKLCKSSATPPAGATWAIKAIRADKAWARFNASGAGVVIAQPDTGVADHRELDEAIDLDRGTDVLAGGGKPIDPLAPSMSSPGHGTATSSVVVSRTSLRIAGSAPGATLVPIRCIDGVIIGAGSAVASAIDHARLGKCDVVTMSLGGPISGAALQRSIERAVSDGMIVLAAAGNCVPFVVYPAWDENVIAIAGTDVNDKPWKGSSRGAKVDVSAPAENVYVARRDRSTDMDKALVEPGQGTSFAVALVAGCAALWLSYHMSANVRAEALRRRITVQDLFRSALRATARRPAGWTSGTMGTGVVNAEKLLALALADIPPPPPKHDAHPGAAVLRELPTPERFSAEVGYLTVDRAQRTNRRRRSALECAVPPTPSPALAAALVTRPRAAGRLAPAQNIVPSPLTPYVGPSEAVRFLGGVATPGKSTAPVTEAQIRRYMAGPGRRELSEHFENLMSRYDPSGDARPEITALRAKIVANIEPVAEGLARGARSTSDFSGLPRVAAEALVALVGRPSLRTTDGMIDTADPQLDIWAGQLNTTRKAMQPIVKAVGRIDVEVNGEHRHVGTGSLIDTGLVMTNRHVIEAFAEPLPQRGGRRRFLLNRAVTISFDDVPVAGGLRFRVREVVAAGPASIGRNADIGKLDVAILDVETSGAGGPLPDPMTPAGSGVVSGPALVMIGYPASPPADAAVDPGTGRVIDRVWDRLWEIFQNEYGVRYLSPGHVQGAPGTLPGDRHGWAFSHDATTLAGCSGAPIVPLGRPLAPCGLHFGGQPLRQNLAHDLSAVATALKAEPDLMDVRAFGPFF